MTAPEGENYANDPNYLAYLSEAAPPWRQDWSTVRPPVAASALTPEEQRSVVESSLRIVGEQVRRLIAQGIHVDREEAPLDGAVGLCEAAGSYDPSRGVKFASYARHRVKGAVIDGIRQYNGLAGEKRTSATVVSQLNNTRAESLFQPVYALAHGETVALIDTIPAVQPSVEESAITSDALLTMHGAIGTLAPRQRDILRLKLQGLGHQAIAHSLDISTRTISRDLQKAYRTLRELLLPRLFD